MRSEPLTAGPDRRRGPTAQTDAAAAWAVRHRRPGGFLAALCVALAAAACTSAAGPASAPAAPSPATAAPAAGGGAGGGGTGTAAAPVSAQRALAEARVLRVYGPGGPAPAMREAAAAFERATGVAVEITAGPTPAWIERARTDADAIFSGSEAMMTDFVAAMQGAIDERTIEPLYLRPMAILVRPGNPRRIAGVADLLRPGLRVMVVHGAGQVGAWEDVAGRRGRIEDVRALRANIVAFAPNSAAARQSWIERPEIDAWLIWNIWQVANPQLADAVPIEPEFAVWRDSGIALTRGGAARPAARQFVEFLRSPEGARIFAKWGWKP